MDLRYRISAESKTMLTRNFSGYFPNRYSVSDLTCLILVAAEKLFVMCPLVETLINTQKCHALNERFLKISVPLENVTSWENDLFLCDFHLAERKGTDQKILYFHFYRCTQRPAD